MEEIRNEVLIVSKNIKYYSDDSKRKIVQEVLDGKFTKAEAQRIYGIGGKNAILEWMRKYNLETNYISPNKPNIAESPMLKEEERSKDEKIRELEKALEIARNKEILNEKVIETERNKARLFEIMIEIAEKNYGIAIKKKPKAKQFGNLNQKKGKK